MPVNSKSISLGYTRMRDSKSIPLGSIIEFWDMPKFSATLLGLRAVMQ